MLKIFVPRNINIITYLCDYSILFIYNTYHSTNIMTNNLIAENIGRCFSPQGWSHEGNTVKLLCFKVFQNDSSLYLCCQLNA